MLTDMFPSAHLVSFYWENASYGPQKPNFPKAIWKVRRSFKYGIELHMVQINSSNCSIKLPNYSTGMYAEQSLFKQCIEKYLKVKGRGSILSTLLGNLGVVNGTLNTVDLESNWDKLPLMCNDVIKAFLQFSVHNQSGFLLFEKSVFSLASNAGIIAD